MPITTRGARPPAADAPLFAKDSTNIATLTTQLLDDGYANQSRPGSANYNWLFNYVSASALHNMIYGVSVYDDTETFPIHAYTNRNGVLYKSIQGSNTGQLPESSPAYWHDTRSPVASTEDTSGPLSVSEYFNMLVTVDTSSGNVTKTFDPGNFVGQTITIITSGPGLAYLKGPGVYVDAAGVGVPVSDGKIVTYVWDGAFWDAEDVVCSEFTVGDFTVIQSANGRMDIINLSDNIVPITNNFQGGFVSDDISLSLPISFVDANYAPQLSPFNLTAGGLLGGSIKTISSFSYRYLAVNLQVSSSRNASVTLKGKY